MSKGALGSRMWAVVGCGVRCWGMGWVRACACACVQDADPM